MTSDFEVKMLAQLVHKNAIENAQKNRIARSVKELKRVASDKYSQFVNREARVHPC